MADVSTPCAEYTASADLWQLIDDATSGEREVKARRERYLPKPNPQDKSKANSDRYDAYVLRAVYYNAAGRTLEGLNGLAFTKDPEVKAPAALDDVVKNLDGAGSTVVQHMHDTLGEVIKNGRAGLLADFPRVVKPVSRADEIAGGVRPTITFYPALAVINWRTVKVGSLVKLSLVVLHETHREYEGFEEKSQDQYRVLLLVGGKYVVEIWRKRLREDKTGEEWYVAETFAPLGGNGQGLDYIPFTFVGSKNNGVGVNKAPMADIAHINIAHYRNSADYEDSVYLTGQPQFWIAGLNEEWRDHLETNGLYVGSRSVLPLPTNASAGVLQADPNTLVKDAMDSKERQMAALGARLVQADSTIKTATQQESEDKVASSVLSLCCDNVSAAYTLAIGWAAMFANTTGEIVVSISTDFAKFTIDATELGALIQGVQAGLIPMSDFWARMRQAGVIAPDKDDAAIKEEIDAMPPPGLGGDDDDDDDDKDAE